ncbi:hypothetical protein IAU60_005441 [Kwoniella sp. DSM 27419]
MGRFNMSRKQDVEAAKVEGQAIGRYLRSRSPFIAEATFEEGDSDERREKTGVKGSQGLGGPTGQARPTAPHI